MQYNTYWMQGLGQPPHSQAQQQSQPDPLPLQQDAQRAASADWKEPSSSNGNGTPSVAQQHTHSQPPTLDLSDFTLADFTGEQPAHNAETRAGKLNNRSCFV